MGYLGVGKMVLTKKICAIKTLKVRRLARKSKEKREKRQKRVFAKSHTNRTYALAVFTSFKRGKRNQKMNISLLKMLSFMLERNVHLYTSLLPRGQRRCLYLM